MQFIECIGIKLAYRTEDAVPYCLAYLSITDDRKINITIQTCQRVTLDHSQAT